MFLEAREYLVDLEIGICEDEGSIWTISKRGANESLHKYGFCTVTGEVAV